MRMFEVEDMLRPVGMAEFGRTYFERAPLFVARGEPAYHERLFSLRELDKFHSCCRPPYAKVFAIDSRRKIATEEFADASGEVDSLRLFDLFEQGATIVYREIENHFPALAALCRSAEKRFNSPFTANVYWAPAGGQCFPIHFDAKDVFALQVSGSKRWRVYCPYVELPLRYQHCHEKMPDEGFLAEFDLRAGDLLYCPRGFPHLVTAANEPSLHISLSTFPYTWADVLNRVMADVFDRNPSFRASLPPGSLLNRGDELHRTFADLVNRFAEAARLEPALDVIAREFVAGRPPCNVNAREVAQQANALSLDSWIESNPETFYSLVREREEIQLVGLRKEIRFDASAFQSLNFALQTARYQIRQLPGELENEAKLDLLRTLLLNGFVRMAAGAKVANEIAEAASP